MALKQSHPENEQILENQARIRRMWVLYKKYDDQQPTGATDNSLIAHALANLVDMYEQQNKRLDEQITRRQTEWMENANRNK